MKRDRAYRRYKTFVKQQRNIKYYLLNHNQPFEELTDVEKGKLRKGKSFCSCNGCNGFNKWHSPICFSIERRKENILREYSLKEYKKELESA